VRKWQMALAGGTLALATLLSAGAAASATPRHTASSPHATPSVQLMRAGGGSGIGGGGGTGSTRIGGGSGSFRYPGSGGTFFRHPGDGGYFRYPGGYWTPNGYYCLPDGTCWFVQPPVM
jgi:hypothetical protein